MGMILKLRIAKLNRLLKKIRRYSIKNRIYENLEESVLASEERFFRIAEQLIKLCTNESLSELMTEIHGLSHYFCSYCKDQGNVDKLVSKLYFSVLDLKLAIRKSVQ